MTWTRRVPLTAEEMRLIRIRDRDHTDVLAVRDRRDLLAELDRIKPPRYTDLPLEEQEHS